jgi:copper(I)-binding protein
MISVAAVSHRFRLLLATMLMTVIWLSSEVFAESPETKGMLRVMDAYQPERPGSMSMSAGYLKIQNMSEQDVYIQDVSSPEYHAVSIHRSFRVDGAHKMESVSALKIPAGELITFEPGGLHLMMHGPLVARKAGDLTTIRFVTNEGRSLTFKMAVVRH